MAALFRLRQFVREISWPHVILFVVLANLPMWIAGSIHKLNVSGWFNLDFFVVGVLALLLPRAISAGLLLIAMVVDLVAEIAMTYYIAPADILNNAPEFVSMRAWQIAQLCAGGLLVALIAAGTFFLPRLNRRLATGILLISFAVVCRGGNELEEYWGVPSGFHLMLHRIAPQTVRAAVLENKRPARSSTRQMIWDQKLYGDRVDEPADRIQTLTPMQSAAGIAYRWVSASSRNAQSAPDFVLILMESWGRSTNQVIRQALVEPYKVVLDGKFTIIEGSVPFHGATISGENRELCERSGGQSVMEAPAASFLKCLPDELRDLGFHTIAIHGNYGGFYHRNYWYQRAGFQEIWFAGMLESSGLPDCVGAFTGVCDSAIADWIGKRLQQPDREPRFVYWVTLNSHLPVPNPPPLPTLVPCDESSLAQDLALCNWYRLILNVHQSIASLAARHGPRPTIYVVVGDHAPPFSEPNIRNSFDQNAVPYVILLPDGVTVEGSSLPQPHAAGPGAVAKKP